MGKKTSISWAQSTVNLAWGCTKVSAECKNCYMYRLSKRFGRDPYTVQLLAYTIDRAEKRIKGLNQIVFVNSMSDTFHESIYIGIIDSWFSVFAKHPEKQFLILTKRAERMYRYSCSRQIPENCWLGVSCGERKAKVRMEWLRNIACRIHFVSFEPVLEDLGHLDLTNIQWAIIGGESDYKNPRPMKPEWAENIIKQCREQNVKVWFKQIGGKGGDGAGGDLINGRRIQEYPQF